MARDVLMRVLRSSRRLVWTVALAVAVAACATQPEARVEPSPPGFIFGLLHGFTIAFSLAGSLFMKVRIYAFPNAGFFYDFGFFLGAAAFLGGGGATARR
jgi:hypothetical protein